MPLHFDDLDIISETEGLKSALIVPCNMCPAVTVAAREGKPFIQFFKSFLKSAPFEQYIEKMQAGLKEKGVNSEVFRSPIPHQWFLCMWTSGRRDKLQRQLEQHDAAIVLGCESATETVRESAAQTGRKVIEGMEVSGFMNARMKVSLPLDVTFDGCRIVPLGGHDADG